MRYRSSSYAAAVACGVLAAAGALPAAVLLAGVGREASSRPALPAAARQGARQTASTARRAVGGQTEALRVLGLDGHKVPSKDEIRRAFRCLVHSLHPDRPGGDPVKFQAVKEAYDFLSGRHGAILHSVSHGHAAQRQGWASKQYDKWRGWGWSGDGRPKWVEDDYWMPRMDSVPIDAHDVWSSVGYNPYSGAYYGPPDPPGADWVASHARKSRRASKEPAGHAAHASRGASSRAAGTLDPSAQEAKRMVGFLFTGLFALVVGLGPLKLASDGEVLPLDEGCMSHGMEYAWAAAIAKTEQAPVLLARGLASSADELAAARVPQQHRLQRHETAVLERARLVVDTLQATLDESSQQSDQQGLKFRAIAAVVHEEHLPSIMELLKERGAGLDDHKDMTVAGRPVVQMKRSATEQKVLLVGASSLGNTGSKLGELGSTLRQVGPDVVMLDMSEAAWRSSSEEFALWTGYDVRDHANVMGPFDLQSFRRTG